MKFLIDTHILLWAALEPQKLSPKVIEVLEDQQHNLVVSTASAWEMAIKISVGKLLIPMELSAFVKTSIMRLKADVIDITLDDTLRIAELPPIHNDPFDRILIVQSLNHGFPLITRDKNISRYKLKVIW